MDEVDQDIMFEAGKHLVLLLQSKGHEALFAGGAVRDMIQGQPWHDIDIATSAPYTKIIDIFNQAGFPTKEVGKAFGVVLVRNGGFEFEVAKFRKDEDCNGRHPSRVAEASSSEDAWRRDFTMNGGKLPDLGIDLSLPKSPLRPWATINLPKDVRKDKTFEEIDALKKELWEKQNDSVLV